MLSISDKCRELIKNDKRDYAIKINMTLANGTTLVINNDDVWDNGLVIEQATSDSNSFNIGSAIIGKCKLTLNNIYEKFSTYDFHNATFVIYLGVIGDNDSGGNQKYYRLGTYTVDQTNYNGSIISLECLDNMWKFDVPFGDIAGVSFPITAGGLVNIICIHCGVTFATSGFDNRNTIIPVAPDKDINCREVLQYVAQICCKYCKINDVGQLTFRWYDKNEIKSYVEYTGGTFLTEATPYSDGDTLDGGNFTYRGGANVDCGTFTDVSNMAFLSSHSSSNVSTDTIVVTGIHIKNSSSDNPIDVVYKDYDLQNQYGSYVLVIENNPFITTEAYAETVANYVGNVVCGTPLRGFTCSCLSDFSIEPGDPCAIIDFRGNRFFSFVTNLTFNINGYENFSCGVQSVNENLTTRYSDNVRTLVEASKNAQKIVDDYNKAVQQMNELSQEALGYNKYEYNNGTGTLTWLYSGSVVDETIPDKPLFPNSANVFKISGDGVFISSDGGQTYTNGYDANSGTAILNLIYAHGISCDWVRTGTLTLGGQNNQYGQLKILSSYGSEIGSWDRNGLTVNSGVISGLEIEGSSIKGGSLTSGNPENGNYMRVSDGAIDGYYDGQHVGRLSWNGTIDASNSIYLQADNEISLQTDKLAVQDNGSDTAWVGQNGSLQFVTDIKDNGDGTITWWTSEITFKKGLMITRI